MKHLLLSLAFLSLVACQPKAKEDDEDAPTSKSAKAAKVATPAPPGSWMWDKKKKDKLAPDDKPLTLDDKPKKS